MKKRDFIKSIQKRLEPNSTIEIGDIDEITFSEEKAVERFEQWIELFKSLEFKKGDILIKPLLSTEEFKEEGDELKHCLYTNEYYLKDDSLVLSARVNGIRTETIEVQLSSLKIIQSRGLGNKETKYHRQIVTLVKKNLDQISELLTLKEAA